MQIREVRNLKRWYLIDHTLSRYNKRNDPITKQQLAILLSIYFLGQSSPIVKTFNISNHLKAHKKSVRPDILCTQLKHLLQLGLIKRTVAGRSFMYSVTITGELELKDIERINRDSRS